MNQILEAGPLSGIGRDLNRFLGTKSRAWRPAIDMFDEGNHLVLQAELAGIEKKDLDIHVEDTKVEIRGRRENRSPDSERSGVFHREGRRGPFHRTIALPTPVNAAKVATELEHGLLTVTLPKAH